MEARQVTGRGAAGMLKKIGVLVTLTQQDVDCDLQKAAGALRIPTQCCHTAHLFKRSKKSGFPCEMAPTKHICGWFSPRWVFEDPAWCWLSLLEPGRGRAVSN